MDNKDNVSNNGYDSIENGMVYQENNSNEPISGNGPVNFDEQSYNSTPNYENVQNNKWYKQSSIQTVSNNTGKVSKLSRYSLYLSLLGCTSFIGAILAILDLTKKDGRKKIVSIISLCICGIILVWFVSGRISSSFRKNHTENEIQTSSSVPGDDSIPTETVTEVITEATEQVINDDNYMDYVSERIEKNGFNSETNKVETIDSYNIEIPTYFGSQKTNDKGFYIYIPLENENEFAFLRFLIIDLGSSSYSNRETDINDLVDLLNYKNYTSKDVVFSGINSVEINGKAKYTEDKDVSVDNRQLIKAGTYYADAYCVIMYDEVNNKAIWCELIETFGTKYDYVEDVKKCLNTLVYSQDGTNKADESGVSSDFKEMLDAYEEFMDEYIEFMELYNKNPTDAELMGQYVDILLKYNEYAATISKLDESEMTDEEAAYYIEVTGRVTQKLINAGLSN